MVVGYGVPTGSNVEPVSAMNPLTPWPLPVPTSPTQCCPAPPVAPPGWPGTKNRASRTDLQQQRAKSKHHQNCHTPRAKHHANLHEARPHRARILSLEIQAPTISRARHGHAASSPAPFGQTITGSVRAIFIRRGHARRALHTVRRTRSKARAASRLRLRGCSTGKGAPERTTSDYCHGRPQVGRPHALAGRVDRKERLAAGGVPCRRRQTRPRPGSGIAHPCSGLGRPQANIGRCETSAQNSGWRRPPGFRIHDEAPAGSTDPEPIDWDRWNGPNPAVSRRDPNTS